MNIIEVRDGFIKFEADDNVFLSSFVLIKDTEKKYVAQVFQCCDVVGKRIASAKLLFLFDEELQPYDNTLPSMHAEIKDFTSNILNNSINAKNPIILGVTPKNDINIVVDAFAFKNKMIVSLDDKKNNNILVRNLSKQFNNINKSVVIIDTLGIVEAKKYVAGQDFKLPLDTASLAFMYEDCLNDATADSKSMIVDIFKDLAEYSKTVPFLPFKVLKSIVEEMVDKSHVFKLLVLKNKLVKFDKLGYFAANSDEVNVIDKILASKCSIIDLSKLDIAFQNRYLAYIYEKLENKNDVQVILELSNTTSKKNLKNIMLNDKVSTTFFTHSRFKYLNDIKNHFDNFIIAPSISNNQIFRVYGSFLNSMKSNEYLIAGESVNYIPVISQIKIVNQFIPSLETLDKNVSNVDVMNDEVKLLEKIQTEAQDDIEQVNMNLEVPLAIEDLQNKDSDLEMQSVINSELAIVEDSKEQDYIDEIDEPITSFDSTMTKEEIIDNIDQKSEAIIADITNNLSSVPDKMFDDDESIDEDSGSELLDEEARQLNDDFLDSETDESSNKEQEFESEDLSNDEDEFSEVSDNEDVFKDENEQQEIFVDESLVETNYPEIIDFNEEDIEENEIVEQISMVEDFESSDLMSENVELDNNLNKEDNLSDEDSITDVNEEIVIPDEIDLSLDDDTSDNDIQLKEEISDDITELQDISLQDELLSFNDNNDELEEIVELDSSDTDANDIVVDIAEDEEPLDNIDEQIVKDVDKVFTTRKDDDISDSDLDFIDELNGDILQEVPDENEVLEELSDMNDEGILEEPQQIIDLKEENSENDEILETKNSTTPIVPVYEAEIPQEDIVNSDPIQQGDMIVHAKYGSGLVEKMIKYGNKTLFSINFDNVGRRLLDPTLTEIKKLNN